MLPLAEGILELRVPRSDVRDDEGLVPLDQLAGRIVGPSASRSGCPSSSSRSG